MGVSADDHRGLAIVAAAAVVISMLIATASAAGAGLRLGDERADHRVPIKGGLYTCKQLKRGPVDPRPWIRRKRWFPSERPAVGGSVSWPQASFTLTPADGGLVVDSNGFPRHHPSGSFPIPSGQPGSGYPETSRALVEHGTTGLLPDPGKPGKPRCVSTREPLGIATDGVPILPPMERTNRDLVAREVVDPCGGSVDAGGRYGYRAGAPCVPGSTPGAGHSEPIGFARDGHWIYGTEGKGGKPLRNKNLDVCHGHTHAVTLADGTRDRRYHYHQTRAFPYLVGCFRGKPNRWQHAARPGAGGPTIRTTPGLYPGFDPAISDYVVTCTGAPVQVEVATDPGTTVDVDGQGAASGRFTRSVALAPGQAFPLTMSTGGASRTHHVRCLPSDFPGWSFERLGEPLSDYFLVDPVSGRYVIMFDDRGVPIWWYQTPRETLDAKLLSDGTIAWIPWYGGGFGTNPLLEYELHRLDGSLVRTVKAVGSVTDGHDLQELPNGNMLLITYKPRDGVDLSAYGGPSNATVVDGEIQEIGPSGNLVWSWNSKDHIDLDETDHWWPQALANPVQLADGRTAYDIVHMNSVEPAGNSLVFSTYLTDSVYEIDRASGDINWKLGGTATPDSLTPVGDPHAASMFGGQHDARILGDGTLTVHDNGTGDGRAPRGVRYAIDETAGTATLLESVTDPQAPSSVCCGSARRLPSGGWLAGWGGNPVVTEFGPGGAPTARLRFTSLFSYRAFPVAPGRLSPADLRAGMDAMFPRP